MDSSLCKNIVKSFYLYQNPLYAFSFPIALICGIIVHGICIATKCSSNSYVVQIIIPILTILIVNWILMKVSCMMLDKNLIDSMTNKCISYVDNIQSSNMNFTENFQSSEEQQQQIIPQNTFIQNDSELRAPLNIIDNLYDSTYEVINPDTREIQMEFNGLNTANFTPIA